MAWFEPLVPKTKQIVQIDNIRPRLEARMKTLMADLQRLAATYEAPAGPVVYGTRKRATVRGGKGSKYVKSGYVRTLTLKKSWSRRVVWKGKDLIGEVASSGQVAPYNVYVRGPKTGTPHQAAHMAARGWKTITVIVDEEWPTARKAFQAILKGSTK